MHHKNQRWYDKFFQIDDDQEEEESPKEKQVVSILPSDVIKKYDML